MSKWMGRLVRIGFVLLFFVPFLLTQIFGFNLDLVDGRNIWWLNLILSPFWTIFGLLVFIVAIAGVSMLFEWIWTGKSDDADDYCG